MNNLFKKKTVAIVSLLFLFTVPAAAETTVSAEVGFIFNLKKSIKSTFFKNTIYWGLFFNNTKKKLDLWGFIVIMKVKNL